MKIIRKQPLLLLLILLLSLALTAACSNSNSDSISADEAETIALEDLGFNENGVSGLRTSSEKDEGVEYYEVEFQAEGVQYSYEIAKTDGAILSKDSDADSIFGSGSVDNNTNANSNDDANSDTTTNTGNTGSGSGSITLEEAKAIALAKVEGATESNLIIKQERDDGKDIYEGSIIYNGVDYDFEIDAANGNILSWEEETANQ